MFLAQMTQSKPPMRASYAKSSMNCQEVNSFTNKEPANRTLHSVGCGIDDSQYKKGHGKLTAPFIANDKLVIFFSLPPLPLYRFSPFFFTPPFTLCASLPSSSYHPSHLSPLSGVPFHGIFQRKRSRKQRRDIPSSQVRHFVLQGRQHHFHQGKGRAE